MITLIVAVSAGLGVFAAACFAADWGVGWSIFSGVVSFAAVQGVAGFILQRRVRRDMDVVQGILVEGQKKLQAKMQRWQVRPPGSLQAAQKEMFEDTKTFVRAALRETERLSKYRLWVPMVERQKATAQLQLSWMIKDFDTVDRLMPRALVLEPTMAAIKMARMYMTGADTAEIAKVYAKGIRRLRYNQNVLLAATWSWILVKRGDADGAFKVLTEALKNSDDATLKRNHEALMNNRTTHFSNSGIGEQWYSLLLEEPRVRMQRQHPVYR